MVESGKPCPYCGAGMVPEHIHDMADPRLLVAINWRCWPCGVQLYCPLIKPMRRERA